MLFDFLGVISIYGMIIGIYFGLRVIFHFLNKPYTHTYNVSSTVVVPVYQENPKVFEECLKSCISNNPSEIIVVDDGSKDSTCYKIALDYAKEHSNLKVDT